MVGGAPHGTEAQHDHAAARWAFGGVTSANAAPCRSMSWTMRLMCTMSTACLVTHEVVCQMNSIDSGMRSMLGRSSDLGAFTPDTRRGDSSASAAPGLTSSRPASYYGCRTRHTRYVGEPHQDGGVTSGASGKPCEPSSWRATDETAGAGEVQANDELGFDRACHA